jgi:peptide/nickel transport system substrate-binding protein/oligopeptide transport system substrate-binding protein
VIAILLTACGAPADSTAPSGSAAAPATDAPTVAPPLESTAPNTGGGTISIGFESDIQYVDPALAYDVVSFTPGRLLFDQLVMYDDSTGLVPGLAEAMPTVSADGKTYTFKLRSGVQFHKPDGSVLRDMTADDVVASLNRILDPKLTPSPSPVGGAFFSIIAGSEAVLDGTAPTATGIRAIDPLTVEIELNAPDKRLLNILAMPFGSVLPAEAGLDALAFGAAPIGTGPYHLVEYKPGESMTFARNETYWGEMPPSAAVEIRIGLDANTQLQQATADQLDLMGDMIPPGAYNATVSDPTLTDRIHRRTDVAVFYLSIDTTAPDSPLSNVLVRRAMNHAIDKENLVRVQNGRGGPAHCILPPAMPGYDPTCMPYTYDVAAAQALMKEAGQAAGFTTQLYTDPSELSKSMAEAIQVDLGKIGITVEIVLQEFDVLLGTITVMHQAPLVYIGWFQDFPDPSDFFDPILSCATAVEGGFNSSWYCNEEVDALGAQALAEQDDAVRLAMYQDIQRRIMDDAPWVPTVLSETVELVSSRVSGTYLHPVYPFDLRTIAVPE